MAKIEHIKKEGEYLFVVNHTLKTITLLGGSITVEDCIELFKEKIEELKGYSFVCGKSDKKDGNIPPIVQDFRNIPQVPKEDRTQIDAPIIVWCTDSTLNPIANA